MSSVLPPVGEPEYLGDAPPGDGTVGRGRRATVVGIAALAVAAVAALGGWAALSWMSTGSQPADALPATTIAYLSVDLDPSAGQKLEALRLIEKIPALDEKLGLDAGDDLRRWAFDRSGLGSCGAIAYEADVAPWLGERAALAVLPAKADASDPEVVVALQVTDEKAASAGLDKLSGCAPAGGDTWPGSVTESRPGPMGYAFADGYVLVAETAATAQSVADEAVDRPLAQDDGFTRWTAAAGDPGIATFYASSEAPAAIMKLAGAVGSDRPWSTYAPDESLGGGLLVNPGPLGHSGRTEQVERLAQGSEGIAAIVRFEGGAVEVELAAASLPGPVAATDTTDLPASTGAAASVALPEGWLDRLLATMSTATGLSEDQLLAQAEAASGLALPGDLEALLGTSLSLVVDSGLRAGQAVAGDDPRGLPVGARVEGDPAEIMPVVDKLKSGVGPAAAPVAVQPGDGAVALGLDEEYVGRLAGEGSLGEDASFRAAVPEADRAGGVLYVNFAAGDDWVERLVEDFARRSEEPSSSDLRENLAALEALGMSTWTDGDVQRGLIRLTTD